MLSLFRKTPIMIFLLLIKKTKVLIMWKTINKYFCEQIYLIEIENLFLRVTIDRVPALKDKRELRENILFKPTAGGIYWKISKK
jgi:hypothetical protein